MKITRGLSPIVPEGIKKSSVAPCSRPCFPVQLLAYHAALVKGADVDKLRNLAKSVTVE